MGQSRITLAHFAYCLLILLTAVGAAPIRAQAECIRWIPNGLAFPYEQYKEISDIVYDVSSQKYSFLQGDWGNRDFKLWQLDGMEWKKTWEGYCSSPEGDFLGPTGLYYDPQLNALVMMAWISRGPEWDQAVGAYRFDPKSGWIYITQEMYAWSSMSVASPIVYDPNRKRAVLPVHHSVYGEWFLEFDGFRFHQVRYQELHSFSWGKAGYDRERKIIMFYGGNEYPGGEENATYEYNGVTFAKVSPVHSIAHSVIAGFAWSDDWRGLLGISCSVYDFKYCGAWLYRENDWVQIGDQYFPADPFEGVMYDGGDGPSPLLMLTFWDSDIKQSSKGYELTVSSHCRPAAKP